MSAGDPAPESDPDLRAGEYVLGTLDAGERAGFAGDLARDPAAAARVRAWERRLAPLIDAVPARDPPPWLRAALLRALPGAGRPDEVRALRRQVRNWRWAAAGSGLLAAGLALFVSVGPRRATTDGTITDGVRADGAGRYLAVVQGGGALPALVVRVDTAAGTAQVRPVGAETPTGRSLEIWYVGAAGPKALGLVGPAPSRVALPAGAAADGVIAVSVEPPGGSPSGAPTGPVVYTGRLIAE